MNVTAAAVPVGLAAKETDTEAERASLSVPSLGSSLIDPELSQLRFYARVLEEAADPLTPLLERVKFLAILGTNLDEFVSVRGPSIPRRYWEVSRIARPDLHYRPLPPRVVEEPGDVFAAISARDVLLHHPHDSFAPVVELLRQASVDPDVSLLAMTLYRLDRESAIAHALLEALKRGKRVQVVVELHARHDEAHNAAWATALERAGAEVVFGAPTYKVHAKLALIERHEADGLRRYAHIGTGNYHAYNAQFYTDLSLLTADRIVTGEIATLFTALAGAAESPTFSTLLMAPLTLRSSLLACIEREIMCRRAGHDGHIVLKTNALIDREVIQALYRASGAGVRVDLVVRGMCALRPGVAGLSDRITVRSIVGRLLEHSRVWYFRNGGAEVVYLGSADLRPVNLDRRVEIMVPVRDPGLVARVRDEVLAPCLADNVLARVLNADGSYTRVRPGRLETARSCQERVTTVPYGRSTA